MKLPMGASLEREIRLTLANIRVISCIGPGDVVGAYEDWKNGIRTISETSITFSSQEFELFAKYTIPYWIISSFPAPASKSDGENRIENRPKQKGAIPRGFKFHYVQLRYALSVLQSAREFRATHAIIDSGTTHWFMLLPFRFYGIKVIPNFHNVYWPSGHKPKSVVKKLIFFFDSIYFRYCTSSAIGVSPECGFQIQQMTKNNKLQFYDYRAQFKAADFEKVRAAKLDDPFRIMFAGRIEENKGVFDILEIARILSANNCRRYLFSIYGAGAALSSLRQQIMSAGLGIIISVHGKLSRPELLAAYESSHLIIVPTKSTFCEGLPMVCAEAILSGRPVITSRLSNALDVLRGALIEAIEDDPRDYAEKIRSISTDSRRYSELVLSTGDLRKQFYSEARSLTATLEKVLTTN